MTETSLKKSPLHEKHVALGAKMADFGGWQMPIEYPGGGVIREHTAVRERVGIFDVSHLGKARVVGTGAADFCNACFTNDLRKVEPPKAQYTMCCDEESGGVVDDLIQYVKSDDEVFLIPNAANTTEVVRRMREKLPEGLELTNLHEEYGVIAVQGPRSEDVVKALGLPTDLEYMSFAEAQWNGRPVIVCRTGYTGEKGYELLPTWDNTPAVWDALVEAMEPFDGLPCGLGARDTLRTEMGYALHGHELSMDITPNMARAGWAVGWGKESFWGKEVLAEQKAAKDCRLSWGLLVTGKGIPRKDCVIRSAGGEDDAVIGVVTSGTMSPTLKQGIALCLLDRGAKEGDEVVVDVRGREVAATVTKPPFVQGGAAS
ncbi:MULTISPECIES: glycine cleavage system aminomethyltransferase GcvT [Arsenicicoccus]|uniref:aminomethyltransferase n=1 Tax=Arsenicicoccus bolidensis TaxID=229480 RepID=A0ABS9Q4B4_9MICO|nr:MULTISPECIES: glycine cleavage system aminomethyltransferase GcvT [Arsenicicoccus]MCG7322702.1 glycine cleavage system aminomethyltransferase GcvT [Arsenicicoccus bolidensis]